MEPSRRRNDMSPRPARNCSVSSGVIATTISIATARSIGSCPYGATALAREEAVRLGFVGGCIAAENS